MQIIRNPSQRANMTKYKHIAILFIAISLFGTIFANAKDVLIAENLIELHLYNRTIIKETALNEKGELVNG